MEKLDFLIEYLLKKNKEIKIYKKLKKSITQIQNL